MIQERSGHPAAVAAWLMLGAVVIAGGVGVVGGIVSTAFVVDLVALWPVIVVALLIGLVAMRRNQASGRSAALLPLSLFTALVLAAALHLGAWAELPSAETRLTGPAVGEVSSPTEFIAQLVGEVAVDSTDSDVAYQVSPILRGGVVGVPTAVETSVDGTMSVVLEADPDAPGWYSYAGWRISLAEVVPWRLVLNGRVDADLSDLTLTSGTFAGRGEVSLGATPPEPVSLIVAGDFTVEVPAGSAVSITGEAEVPAGWQVAGSISSSPGFRAGEPAWNIVIQNDGRVRLVES